MKNQGNFAMDRRSGVVPGLLRPRLACRPSLLHWVTTEDVQNLRELLQVGWVPLDFRTRLAELAAGSLADQQIERNCQLFLALLAAAHNGTFRGASGADCDRLLTVLAYVRKTEDAIPDYRDEGFVDDQQEVHAANVELASLLQGFKAWRLRNEVPRLWWGEKRASTV